MANREAALSAVKNALDKLKVGGSADAGVKLVERNRQAPVPEDMVPALVMEDGDSTAEVSLVQRHGLTGAAAEDEDECTIWGEVQGPPATVGTTLNTLLGKVIKQLATDTALKSALGVHGRIVKKDTVISYHAAEQVAGIFGLTIGVTTILNPSDP